MSDQRQQLTEMKKFMQISEGSWQLPRSKEDFDKLAAILNGELNNSEIQSKLYNVLGSDSLFDLLDKLEPFETDAPQVIEKWMQDQRKSTYSDFPNIWNTYKLSQRHDSPMSEGDPLDAQNFGTEAEWKEEYAMRNTGTYFRGDCKVCNGYGEVDDVDCEACYGTGEIPEGYLEEDENDTLDKMCGVCLGGRREGYGNDCPNCGGEGYIDEAEEHKELFPAFKYRYIVRDTFGNKAYVGVTYNDTMTLPKIKIWNDQKMQLSPSYITDLPGGNQEVKDAFNNAIFDVIFDENHEPRHDVTSADVFTALRKIIYNNFDIKDFTGKMDGMTLDENNTESCPACSGTGHDDKGIDGVCEKCHGAGVKNEYWGRDPQQVSDKLSGIDEVKHDSYGATPVYENDECTRCFGFGHLPSGDGKVCPDCGGSGNCPHIDEEINLDDIVENVLQEYPGQPKDHYDPDDDLGPAAQGKSDIMKDVGKELGIDVVDMPMSDYENDTIDPEYDDSELGFRFD